MEYVKSYLKFDNKLVVESKGQSRRLMYSMEEWLVDKRSRV